MTKSFQKYKSHSLSPAASSRLCSESAELCLLHHTLMAPLTHLHTYVNKIAKIRHQIGKINKTIPLKAC